MDKNELVTLSENGALILFSEISTLIEHNRRIMLANARSTSIFLF